MNRENLILTYFLEFPEQPSETIYPVCGRSGHIYGYASYNPARGKYALEMTEAQFEAAKQDIFSCGKRYYYPVPALEITFIDAPDAPTAEVIVPLEAEMQIQPNAEPAPVIEEAPAVEDEQPPAEQEDEAQPEDSAPEPIAPIENSDDLATPVLPQPDKASKRRRTTSK
jgi:hypothetical protein